MIAHEGTERKHKRAKGAKSIGVVADRRPMHEPKLDYILMLL